jgi:hypothetical protein
MTAMLVSAATSAHESTSVCRDASRAEFITPGTAARAEGLKKRPGK